MYDQIYTYSDKDKKNESEGVQEEKIKFGFKDILAMTIAAYQVVLIPFSIVILAMIILYLLFSLLA